MGPETKTRESLTRIRELVDKAKEIDKEGQQKHQALFVAARVFFEKSRKSEMTRSTLQNLEEALNDSEEFLFL